jgi:hypothetical protein
MEGFDESANESFNDTSSGKQTHLQHSHLRRNSTTYTAYIESWLRTGSCMDDGGYGSDMPSQRSTLLTYKRNPY